MAATRDGGTPSSSSADSGTTYRSTGQLATDLAVRARDAATASADIALGVASVLTRPALLALTASVDGVESATRQTSGTVLGVLPDEGHGVRTTVSSLEASGREARTATTESVARAAVSGLLSNRFAQSAIEAAVDEVLDDMVTAAVPSIADRVAREIGVTRIDTAVRASIERVLPQALERSLTADVMRAASLPARTAWRVVRPVEPAEGKGTDGEAGPGPSGPT